MDKLFQNTTFAVVDLETTGTQRENNNHIIQFGCAIIKNMKVTKTYSFMMNPHREIPLSIQNLTGINDDDVKDAKPFEYYAPQIQKILKDTIFVAHNVNFDLPFLNYELMNSGFEALTNKSIDTVELAKIAFPTLPSYKLTDLTNYFNIKHLDPHKADSDAYSTAILLIKIIESLKKLPQATLNTLESLSSELIGDTSYIISKIADYYRQSKRPLAKDCIQIRNIVIQKQDDQQDSYSEKSPKFPQDNKAKKELFKKSKLYYRKAQVDLINHIHNFLNNEVDRAMIVEAPNGTGKTFAYLFSYAYKLYSGRKLVVATPTKVLQDQIIRQEIPQLLKVTGLDLKAELVKSSSHYLDLDGFVQSLFNGTNNKPTLVLQMQILVWLTQTKTGDLDELQLTDYSSPLFTQISHPGDARVGSRFAEVDFWNLARKRQEQADILVTNHAYLANNYMDTIWGQNPYLVIDEAHRFTDNVINSRNDALHFESLWGTISHIRNLLYYGENNIQSLFSEDVDLNFLLNKLESESLNLIYKINDLQENLYNQRPYAVGEVKLPNGNLELSFLGNDLFPKNGQFRQLLTKYEDKLEQFRQNTNQILFKLYQKQNSLLSNEESLLSELSEQIDHLDYFIEKSYQLADLIADSDRLEQEGFTLTITNPDDPLSTNLNWIMLDAHEQLTKIYDRFDHILFVSATLTVDNNFNYSIKQLALENLFPVTYIGKSSFDLSKHLESICVTDMPEPNDEDFEKELLQIITHDLKNKDHVLILMTNLELIKSVFQAIVNEPLLKDFEILAQGITGSNNRIAKRFDIASKAIILGANSFWEGIDFHDTSVDVVITTRLPFESPELPEVKLRHKYLKQLDISVFELDSLPRAIVRFRQGIGRVIRGENDYGQFVILDKRLYTKDYGRLFLDAIPVKTEKIKENELENKLRNYDQRRHKKNN